jgi:ATP-dependent Zn protease
VSFFSISGSEFVEMFVGVGAARVRDLFEQARRAAPCIIFIDELDALGRSRMPGAFGGYDEKEQTLNQLLAELDGFDPSTGVILLAATNRPEVLDPALLRPGRFDRQVLVDRPDRTGRREILKVHAAKVHLAGEVDLDQIAGLTPGFTGADLANLEDRFLLARHDLENRVSVLMGGRAAEALIFDGEVSTGASDDLQRATEVATEMVTRYGMNETLGLRTYAPPPQPFLTGTTASRIEASEMTEREIDIAVRDILAKAFDRATEVLQARRADLDEGAHLLLAQETVTADQFPAIRSPAHREIKPAA